MKFVIETKQPEAAQEFFFELLISATLLSGILIAIGSIDTIISKISDLKNKKNLSKFADKIIDSLQKNSERKIDYPHVGDKDENGNLKWKTGDGDKFKLVSPENIKEYNKKVFNTVSYFANLPQTINTKGITTLEKKFISEFGKENITVSVHTLEDSWLDGKENNIWWPDNAWYHIKRSTNPKFIDEFHEFDSKWKLSLIPFITKIKQNAEAIYAEKQVDDKQEMSDRLIYLELAYAILKWVSHSVDVYGDCADTLEDMTAVTETND